MFTINVDDINSILQDYEITIKCVSFSELQRYHYEKDDPASKEVRLIIKAELEDSHSLVIRFKNESDAPIETIEAQSRFAALLKAHGIQTPNAYASKGFYARQYQINGYEVVVTVEDFVCGEIHLVNAEIAEKTGKLLARMHNIAETEDFHVQSEVLFNPLKSNDLFDFEAFAANKNKLIEADEDLYCKICQEHELLLQKITAFEKDPSYAVQGDLSDCNLYMTRTGEIGVFDFNRCGDNNLYFDAVMQALFVARLMDYPEIIAGNQEQMILRAFLKGYHQERPFTERQKEVYPYLYAIISAFWLGDMKFNNDSLENAIKEDDFSAIHHWMETILERARLRQLMPI